MSALRLTALLFLYIGTLLLIITSACYWIGGAWWFALQWTLLADMAVIAAALLLLARLLAHLSSSQLMRRDRRRLVATVLAVSLLPLSMAVRISPQRAFVHGLCCFVKRRLDLHEVREWMKSCSTSMLKDAEARRTWLSAPPPTLAAFPGAVTASAGLDGVVVEVIRGGGRGQWGLFVGKPESAFFAHERVQWLPIADDAGVWVERE